MAVDVKPGGAGVLRRWGGGLVSAAGLLLMLAGLPWALIEFVGWPLPSSWPSGQQWLAWLERPVTVPFLVGLFACVGWLLWAALTVAVVAEVAAVVGRVDTSRLGLPTPLRAVAAGLVGAVVLAVVGTAARAATPAPATAVAAAIPAGQAAAQVPARPAVVFAVPPRAQTTTTTRHYGTVTFTMRGQRYHAVVNRGDTMSKIAKQWLGDADRWPEICRLNWHRHYAKTGGKLRDCDIIHPSWDLRLPSDAEPPPGAVRIDAPARPAPPASKQPTPEPPQPAQTDTAPTADPDGVVDTATESAPPATDQQHEHPAGTGSTAHADDGVTLPGGWISTAMAAGLLAAAAAVWAARRRRYQPRNPASLHTTDPWWQPLPDIIRRLRQASRPDHLDDADLELDDEPITATASTYAADLLSADAFESPEPASQPRLPARPGRDSEERDLTTVSATTAPVPTIVPPVSVPRLAGLGTLPPGGLALTGPGAVAAARGLLVATLTSASPNRGTVITTSSTARATLGHDTPVLTGLTVAADTAEAITHITQLTLTRNRRRNDDPTENADPQPTVTVLLKDTGGHGNVLDALLPVAAEHGIATVLLHPHPAATTLAVGEDGRTDRGDRVAVLDQQAASDLLHLNDSRPAPATGAQPDTATIPDDDGQGPNRDTNATATPPGAAKVQVKIIGRPQILGHDGRPVTGLRAAAVQTLVLLAVHRTPLAKIDLWEVLFPDATMQRAEERFAVTIADLRNGFRRATGDKTINAVTNSRGRYHLDPHLVDVDLWRFGNHLATAARTTDPDIRQHHLLQALDLHTGPLADSTDYEWIEPYRHAHIGKVLDILVALADATDDPHESAQLLDRACELMPENDAVSRRAMRAWADLRQFPRALRVIDRHRAAVADLDAEVDPRTQRVAFSIFEQARA